LWAVVGLGNPGRRYSETRHNVGLTVVKRMARKWKVKLRKKIFSSKAAELLRDGEKIILAYPLTYMNASGAAVKQIIEGRGIEAEHLVVVYDDLDIPLGEVRVKKSGGPGTHKGMNSIVDEVQTQEFPRIRVGIGPLPPGVNATDYVLSAFEKEEVAVVEQGLKKAIAALELVLSGDIEKAMTVYNQRERAFSTQL
jgi:PTH1 family peptidyl-tRNA hydrolase